MRSETDRDSVCDAYERWFEAQLTNSNEAFQDEMDRLERLARAGDLTLLCV